MRYLINVVHDRPVAEADVPSQMYEAMGAFVSELAADGILVDAAGLEPTERGTRVDLRGGEVKIVDGPFAEAKEWVGGYFIVQCRAQEEAVAIARRSAELHREHAPGMELVHEVRRILDEE